MGRSMVAMRRGLACLCLLALAAGCDWFDDPSPEVIRVTIEGEADDFSVITSTNFVAAASEGGSTRLQVFDRDSLVTDLPIDRSWNIGDVGRFLMIAAPAGADTVAVRVRVLVDDRVVHDRRHSATPDAPVQFVYRFNQPVLGDFELL